MIDLRGLHLGNIARSPAESVRPDLWPDHAWVPALGCTGGVLYDLCGQRPAAGAATLGWARGSSGYGVLTNPNDSAYRYPLQTNLARSWSLPWTAVVVAAPFSSGTDCQAFGCWPKYFPTGGWKIWYDAGGTGPSWSMAFARRLSDETNYRIIGNNSPSGGVGLQSVAIGGWRGGTSAGQWFLCVDGASVTESFTSGGDPIYPGDTTVTVFALGEGADSPFFGVTAANMLYWRALSIGQSLDLTADPLLPFRRRVPVFYSVPSGGGSSLAASSAWRVFTATAIDTAWAIRAALNGATAWAVLTQSGAATAWRITAASDADTAWSLRAAAASPSAWRILAASEADTAWRIVADMNASTAWAILTSLDAATAWAIISAGTLLANTGWAIRTDADADTGWLIKDGLDNATAWAIRNGLDATTAWDIQAALANATAWRITTDMQADTAWTVITDMDSDSAWRILRAEPADTGWLVFDALEADTGWVVLSDIIPVAVRTFLAQDRPFMINAARRLLIITKKRP